MNIVFKKRKILFLYMADISLTYTTDVLFEFEDWLQMSVYYILIKIIIVLCL